jgi:hypothetical protein
VQSDEPLMVESALQTASSPSSPSSPPVRRPVTDCPLPSSQRRLIMMCDSLVQKTEILGPSTLVFGQLPLSSRNLAHGDGRRGILPTDVGHSISKSDLYVHAMSACQPGRGGHCTRTGKYLRQDPHDTTKHLCPPVRLPQVAIVKRL